MAIIIGSKLVEVAAIGPIRRELLRPCSASRSYPGHINVPYTRVVCTKYKVTYVVQYT